MIIEAIIEIDEEKKKIIKIHSSREMGKTELETWKFVDGLLKDFINTEQNKKRSKQ